MLKFGTPVVKSRTLSCKSYRSHVFHLLQSDQQSAKLTLGALIPTSFPFLTKHKLPTRELRGWIRGGGVYTVPGGEISRAVQRPPQPPGKMSGGFPPRGEGRSWAQASVASANSAYSQGREILTPTHPAKAGRITEHRSSPQRACLC